MSVISQRGGSSSINEMSVYMRESLTGPDFSKPISLSRFSGNRQAGAQLQLPPLTWFVFDVDVSIYTQRRVTVTRITAPLRDNRHLTCSSTSSFYLSFNFVAVIYCYSFPPVSPVTLETPFVTPVSGRVYPPRRRIERWESRQFFFIILFSIYLFVCLFGLANAAELRALVVLSLALCL